jgi:hypothetical protein
VVVLASETLPNVQSRRFLESVGGAGGGRWNVYLNSLVTRRQVAELPHPTSNQLSLSLSLSSLSLAHPLSLSLLLLLFLPATPLTLLFS